jgi:hypothetical protein
MSYKRLLQSLLCFSIVSVLSSPAFAIVGIGVHYGYDLSLSMADKLGEQTTFNDLKLSTSTFGTPPAGFSATTISGKDLPITINRTNFQRNAMNVGGKIYLDFIPFINAIELSVNYGMWQYDGSITYPDSIAFKSTQPSDPNAPFIDRVDVNYDTTRITMKDLGLDNPFLKNTPYAKLNFDLTIRKYIVQFPPAVHILKVYGGAGASLIFATPVLSSGFIEKAIGSALNQQFAISDFSNSLFNQNGDTMKKLGEEFMKELFTPHYGAHLDLGAMIKIPIIPIGLYVDGKYMIPFGQLDDNVKELKSSGLLFNAGLAFAL